VMLDSSGAPLEPLLAALLALDPELHAVMPTVSPAIASTSALWHIREAFIVLLLFSFFVIEVKQLTQACWVVG
jgi:hypothetical protein